MAENKGNNGHDAAPEGFVEEQIGFPPYWTPEEGKSFYARVIEFDDRDPEFPRYIMQAGRETPCEQGGGEKMRPITVKKGEFFTVSEYSGLPLGRYIGIPVFVTALNKRKLEGNRTTWDWTLRIPEQAKAILQKRREAAATARVNQQRLRPAPAPSQPITSQQIVPSQQPVPEGQFESDDDIPF